MNIGRAADASQDTAEVRGDAAPEVEVTQTLAVLPLGCNDAGLHLLHTRRRATLGNLLAIADTHAAELRRFATHYDVQVGAAIQQLDLARSTHEQWLRRLDAVRSSPQALEQLEAQLRAEREDAATVAAAQAAARRVAAQHEREIVGDLASVAPDPEDVRAVYRRLAQRHHPDLADNEEDRTEREATMQRINTALERRDLTLLRDIEQEDAMPHGADGVGDSTHRRRHGRDSTASPQVRDAAALLRDIARYELGIAQHRARHAAHEAGNLHRLWNRCQIEPRLLHWLATAARRQTEELEIACAALKRQVDEVLEIASAIARYTQVQSQPHDDADDMQPAAAIR